MRYSEIIDRLHAMGGDGWEIHWRARAMVEAGHDVIELSIGEPDIAPPASLVDATVASLRAGRTKYAPSAGEEGLRSALARRYSRTTGRSIGPEQVLCLPGTQTALYVAVRALAGPGDEVVIGDPMYATYEPVVTACGADVVRVPLHPERGFRLHPADLAAAITPRTRAVLINSPHNPTGAVLTASDVAGIGTLAAEHDIWILSDEVYEELIFDRARFASPLASTDLSERTVVLNSISKSHGAPGLRSGWCVGPEEFVREVLPLAEAILFGNQPFIADATASVMDRPSPVAPGMAERFAARADRLVERVDVGTGLRVHRPESGMFALIDVSGTGLDGDRYAADLLERGGVAVIPGSSFGRSLTGWVRVALTRPDAEFDEACDRMVNHARGLVPAGGSGG